MKFKRKAVLSEKKMCVLIRKKGAFRQSRFLTFNNVHTFIHPLTIIAITNYE